MLKFGKPSFLQQPADLKTSVARNCLGKKKGVLSADGRIQQRLNINCVIPPLLTDAILSLLRYYVLTDEHSYLDLNVNVIA